MQSTPDAAGASHGHWTLDEHTYIVETETVQDKALDQQGGMILTAVAEAHQDTSNGEFSGGVAEISMKRISPGTYRLVPTQLDFAMALSNSDVAYLMVQVGINKGGSTVYEAQGGRLVVTQDGASGRLRFSTDGPVTAIKGQEVLGGVKGAPAAMTLQLHDAR